MTPTASRSPTPPGASGSTRPTMGPDPGPARRHRHLRRVARRAGPAAAGRRPDSGRRRRIGDPRARSLADHRDRPGQPRRHHAAGRSPGPDDPGRGRRSRRPAGDHPARRRGRHRRPDPPDPRWHQRHRLRRPTVAGRPARLRRRDRRRSSTDRRRGPGGGRRRGLHRDGAAGVHERAGRPSTPGSACSCPNCSTRR